MSKQQNEDTESSKSVHIVNSSSEEGSDLEIISDKDNKRRKTDGREKTDVQRLVEAMEGLASRVDGMSDSIKNLTSKFGGLADRITVLENESSSSVARPASPVSSDSSHSVRLQDILNKATLLQMRTEATHDSLIRNGVLWHLDSEIKDDSFREIVRARRTEIDKQFKEKYATVEARVQSFLDENELEAKIHRNEHEKFLRAWSERTTANSHLHSSSAATPDPAQAQLALDVTNLKALCNRMAKSKITHSTSELLQEVCLNGKTFDNFFVDVIAEVESLFKISRNMAVKSISSHGDLSSNTAADKPDFAITIDKFLLIVGEAKPNPNQGHYTVSGTVSQQSDLLKLVKICVLEIQNRSIDPAYDTVFAVQLNGYSLTIYAVTRLGFYDHEHHLCLLTELFTVDRVQYPIKAGLSIITLRHLARELNANLHEKPDPNSHDTKILLQPTPKKQKKQTHNSSSSSSSSSNNNSNNNNNNREGNNREDNSDRLDDNTQDKYRKVNEHKITRGADGDFDGIRMYRISRYPPIHRTGYSVIRNVASRDDVLIKIVHDASHGINELSVLLTASQVPSVVRPIACGLNGKGNLHIVFTKAHALPSVLQPEQYLTLARQLANTVAGLHKFGVIHRDIKPEHIMTKAGGLLDLVLIDFSLAVQIDTASGSVSLEHLSYPGTKGYAAPEAVSAFESGSIEALTTATTTLCDVWSMAVTLLYLLKKVPNVHQSTKTAINIYMEWLTAKDSNPQPFNDFIAKEHGLFASEGSELVRFMIPILSSMLQPEPRLRPSARKVASQLCMFNKQLDTKRTPLTPLPSNNTHKPCSVITTGKRALTADDDNAHYAKELALRLRSQYRPQADKENIHS